MEGVAEGAKENISEELSGMGSVAIRPVEADKSTYVASGPGFLNQLVNLFGKIRFRGILETEKG